MENNIPAFPQKFYKEGDKDQSGMTMLDYFAAIAIQGALTNPPLNTNGSAGLAKAAYVLAEAMMEERKKHIKP